MPTSSPATVLLAAFLLAASACQATRAPGAAETATVTTTDAAAVDADFDGVWESTYGILRLTRAGERFAGSYTGVPGATLEGEVQDGVLRGVYHEPAAAGDGVRGRFAFALAADGGSFHGAWSAGPGAPLDPADADAPRWRGRRVVGEPGRVWFVILEENWEGSLREDEYSFGAMLRAFFERVPSVAVRHRYVHDRADLERYCAELSGLVEPVVLYVSSHGSAEGLGIGADGVSPEALGAALRSAGDLRLLHLGACALLAGDAPERIRTAAGPGKSFPISGFVESVDWAASALVDLTYMQLVLEQGLDPADAVAATRRMLTFANPPGDTGALPGCDLAVSVAGP